MGQKSDHKQRVKYYIQALPDEKNFKLSNTAA